MGATSACHSAPATQRTARLHTEQRRSHKEMDSKVVVHNSLFTAHQSQTKYFSQTFRHICLWWCRLCSWKLSVRLNDCKVEKTASGRRKLMYVSSENADLLANFRYDRVDLG